MDLFDEFDEKVDEVDKKLSKWFKEVIGKASGEPEKEPEEDWAEGLDEVGWD